jgi:hypothetical protein
MIAPSKHINFSESLLGLGSFILKNLDKPRSLDELWRKYKSDHINQLYYAKHSFDNFILTIVFLYSMSLVTEKDGEILKCD